MPSNPQPALNHGVVFSLILVNLQAERAKQAAQQRRLTALSAENAKLVSELATVRAEGQKAAKLYVIENFCAHYR